MVGGSKHPDSYRMMDISKKTEMAIVTTEVFQITSNENFKEIKGYPLPDYRFHYGHNLVTSLDK